MFQTELQVRTKDLSVLFTNKSTAGDNCKISIIHAPSMIVILNWSKVLSGAILNLWKFAEPN